MKKYERAEIALKGGKPDMVPVFPVFDYGYAASSIGCTARDYITSDSRQRTEIIEQNFLRHETDGFFVHRGCNDDWVEENIIEKFEDYWLITETKTSNRYKMFPDGRKSPPGLSSVKPIILTYSDASGMIPDKPSRDEIERLCLFKPLKRLASKYREHHFSFQITTPMVRAVNLCGGYEQGLTLLAENRSVFREILEMYTPVESALLTPGREAGARSVWLTSYYTGADTISPKDYSELVFPYEKKLCLDAKGSGLYVLYWFLGDIMPILDKVLELPIDALVLEQGRKGYVIDPVDIRKKAGSGLCIFGFGFETDYCKFNKNGLETEFIRQFNGAGMDGAFVCGTPIMPPDADPEAVDYYFSIAGKYGIYE